MSHPALIPIVAALRDQAERLRKQAEKMVKLSGVRHQIGTLIDTREADNAENLGGP